MGRKLPINYDQERKLGMGQKFDNFKIKIAFEFYFPRISQMILLI